MVHKVIYHPGDGAARLAELRAMALPISAVVMAEQSAPVFVCNLADRPDVLHFLRECQDARQTVNLEWETHSPAFHPDRNVPAMYVFCLVRYNAIRFAIGFDLNARMQNTSLASLLRRRTFGLAVLVDNPIMRENDPSILNPVNFPVSVEQADLLLQSIGAIAIRNDAHIKQEKQPWKN